jgi:hypothetical protein
MEVSGQCRIPAAFQSHNFFNNYMCEYFFTDVTISLAFICNSYVFLFFIFEASSFHCLFYICCSFPPSPPCFSLSREVNFYFPLGRLMWKNRRRHLCCINLLHLAQSFLRSLQSCCFTSFMAHGDSLPCKRKPFTGTSLKPDESNLYMLTLFFFNAHFNIYIILLFTPRYQK